MARIALIILIVFLSGCHGSSSGLWFPCHMTPEAEALAGTRAAPRLEARYGGIVRDAQAEQRMERLGQRLCTGTPAIPCRLQCRILDSEKINAFSLPGGRVYVTRGLYAQLVTDDLLAAVLAHEAAHITSRDHFKSRCSSSRAVLDRETCADITAVGYLQAAGVKPKAMLHVVQIIEDVQPQGWSDIRSEAIIQSLNSSG
ncbi:MAG: M48 family metalloprotease [Phycisphaerae bacterium]|nr:M48 family metalloprotease [Phycisphaerae bacterium]